LCFGRGYNALVAEVQQRQQKQQQQYQTPEDAIQYKNKSRKKVFGENPK